MSTKIILFKLLIVTILFLITGCFQNKTSSNTDVFNDYLKTEFHLNIPLQKHHYVIIPELICKGCTENNLLKLNDLITENNHNKITLIYSNHYDIIPKNLLGHINILFDKNGKINSLNLNIANITLISTEHNEIKLIKSFNTNEDDLITKYLN
jgi:hypothetical protein